MTIFEPSLKGIDAEKVLLLTEAWMPFTVTFALLVTVPPTAMGDELNIASSWGDVMVRLRSGTGSN